MRIDEIESLVDLVARAGVTEVTVKAEGRRVTVRKAAGAPPAAHAASQPARSSALHAASAPEEPEEMLRWIVAPMVGIFHHAEPPVSPGVRVESGQVVGAIESMKLMNDIRAEESGVIVESMAEAGMAVEYGQPLFGLAAQEEQE